MGIVPSDTELTARPDLFPAWDSLAKIQKKLYVRQMQVFAGFSENADWNVGRLPEATEDLGETDNTLIFYTWGDNGASMEGTLTGSFNEMTFLHGVVLDADHHLFPKASSRRSRNGGSIWRHCSICSLQAPDACQTFALRPRMKGPFARNRWNGNASRICARKCRADWHG